MTGAEADQQRAGMHAKWTRAKGAKRAHLLGELLKSCEDLIGKVLADAGRTRDEDARSALTVATIEALGRWRSADGAPISGFLWPRLDGALKDLGRAALKVPTQPLIEERDQDATTEIHDPVPIAAEANEFMAAALADVPVVCKSLPIAAEAVAAERAERAGWVRLAELIGGEYALVAELMEEKVPTHDIRRARFAEATGVQCVSADRWFKLVRATRQAVADLTQLERYSIRDAIKVPADDDPAPIVWTSADDPAPKAPVIERLPLAAPAAPRVPTLTPDEVSWLAEFGVRTAPQEAATSGRHCGGSYHGVAPVARPRTLAAYQAVEYAKRVSKRVKR
jgi:hypothetical protein